MKYIQPTWKFIDFKFRKITDKSILIKMTMLKFCPITIHDQKIDTLKFPLFIETRFLTTF